MRATIHNARKGKNGTFSAKHNDRNFDIREADHIDQERESQNWYWQRYDEPMSFEDAEKKFYRDTFSAALKAQNDRHLERRQANRVRTMDQYRQAFKTCPEETLYYIGSKKDGTVDRDTLMDVVIDQINWESRRFPAAQLLDVALHMDEGGAPHIHERKVWVSHDKDGNPCVGQAAALAEMGIQRPHPEKKISRYNNPKQTYSAECREHFMQLCREHGLEIIEQPQEKSKSGLEQDEYKAQQEQQRAAHAAEQARQAEQDAQNARESLQKAQESVKRLQDEEFSLDSAIVSKQADLDDLNRIERQKQQNIDHAKDQQVEALRERDAARADLDVTKRLQVLSEDLKNAKLPDVEVIRETEAKTSMFGKETPATVTISRDDFDKLRKTAGELTLMQSLVTKLESAISRMYEWAGKAFMNKIDAKEILTDSKVQEESARADKAERQWRTWYEDSKSKDKKISSLSAELEQEKSNNKDLAELQRIFPREIHQLVRRKRSKEAEYAYDHMEKDIWGQRYCVFEGKSVNVRWLLKEYQKDCQENGITPRKDMIDHLDFIERDRGIER